MNVIMAPGHPFGSASAKRSLANLRRLGANAIAVVRSCGRPGSPVIVRGSDMTDAARRHPGPRLGSGKLGRRGRHG
jgi:hypothetical protein